jgi:hypothetical protein
MSKDQQEYRRNVEWAILLLGVPGIAVIFLPFTPILSPWSVLTKTPVFSAHGDWIRDCLWICMHLPFLASPLVTLAQLSRCLQRQLGRHEKRGLSALAYLFLLAIPVVSAAEFLDLVQGRYDLLEPSHMAALVLLGLTAINLMLVRRMLNRQRSEAYECLVMGVYVSAFGMWATGLHDVLGVGGAVMAWTCGVYGVSYWRRVQGAREVLR